MQTYKTYAYFAIKDFDCDYSDITQLMGCEPTHAHNKNSSRPQTPHTKRTTSSWALHSAKPETEIFLDTHVESILELIEPKANIIKALTSTYYVGIQCVGYYTKTNPGFHMSSALLHRVAALGLWMDFDLYCVCDEDSEH
jgi:hypothetical protein